METAEKLDTGSNDDQGAFQKPFLSLFPNVIKVKKRRVGELIREEQCFEKKEN